MSRSAFVGGVLAFFSALLLYAIAAASLFAPLPPTIAVLLAPFALFFPVVPGPQVLLAILILAIVQVLVWYLVATAATATSVEVTREIVAAIPVTTVSPNNLPPGPLGVPPPPGIAGVAVPVLCPPAPPAPVPVSIRLPPNVMELFARGSGIGANAAWNFGLWAILPFVLAGIAALVALLAGTVIAVVTTVVATVLAVVGAIVGLVGALVVAVLASIGAVIAFIVASIGAVLLGLGPVGAAILAALAFIGALVAALVGPIAALLGAIAALIGPALALVATIIGAVLGFIATLIGTVLALIGTFIGTILVVFATLIGTGLIFVAGIVLPLLGPAGPVILAIIVGLGPLGTFGALLALVNFLALFPIISRSRVYQGVLGWSSWFMPMSWLATGMGLLLFLASVVTAPFFPGVTFAFDATTGTVETRGGVAFITGFNGGFDLGNFTFVGLGNAPFLFTCPSVTSHETGHVLNVAAFGSTWHLLGNAIEENILPMFRGDLAYGELIAESHFPRAGSIVEGVWT